MHVSFDDVTPANAPDMLAAMPDGIALALGQNVRAAHPFAEYLTSSPLRMGAFAAGQLVASRRSGEPYTAVVSRGLRSLQFAGALASGFQDAARKRFDKQAHHRTFVNEIEVEKLGEPERQSEVALNSSLVDVTKGNEPYVTRARLQDGESITLSSFGRVVDITREQVINDDQKAIAEAISEMGVTAARHEGRLVAEALEANPTMRDGLTVFHADHGNVLATAFGEAAISAALAALRNQVWLDGLPINAAAAYLVVAPALEYTAYKLVHDSGLPIEVSVLASLPVTRYYLLTAKDIARTIAVARLNGSSHPLRVEPVKTPLDIDGLSLRVSLDVGANMVGHRGILRGGS